MRVPRILLCFASRTTALRVQPTGTFESTVTILERSKHYVAVSKPPAVVCHHSEFTGSRSQLEIPMLQRVREALGRKVNLVHRLDRGCSGCLLFTYTNDEVNNSIDTEKNPTALLAEAMSEKTSQKTYLALVRGEGLLHGRDFKKEGWFKIDRPIKDEKGKLNNATTWFRFVAGQDNDRGKINRPRASLVLCRPETGRWHQIRRHLNGLSHPILGDSTHGNSQENRKWLKLGMPRERTCLHLAHLHLCPTPVSPNGVDITCPIAPDMMQMLEMHLPNVLETARPLLLEEGIDLAAENNCETLPISFEMPSQ